MSQEIASYLSQLKFDPKLYSKLHSKYITNFRIVLLLILSILIVGLFNFFNIPRRLNPEVKIAIVTIQTVLPGANPEDIEALITNKIEDKVKSVEGIDTITSSSRENISVVAIQFVSGVDPDKAQSDVQQLVDTVTDLPDDALTPKVQAIDFENQPVWTFALVSRDVPSLMKLSRNLEKKLEDQPKIDRIQLSGNLKQNIYVTVDPLKANEYNISPILLSQSIKQATASYPAGNIKSNNSTISLSIDPFVQTVDDIRNITLSIQEKAVRLEDIATVQESSATDQARTFYADSSIEGEPAVQFFIYKTKTSDIDTAAKAAEDTVNAFLKPYGNNVKLVSITNTGNEITTQFSDLLNEFRTTIILIFLLLLVFLGLRQAVIASFTVPLTFLSAIALAHAFGMTLNFLTLFSFLIALGLLIDDTIVVVTAMTRYYGTGKFTPSETGMLVWRDFIVPIWSTTITTIWSFAPLFLSTGIIGEFIKPIPIIITSTLVSSTSIAVLITIPLMIIFLKPQFPRRIKILLLSLLVISAIGFLFLLVPKNILLLPTLLILIIVIIFIGIYRKLLFENAKTYYQKNRRLQKIGNRVLYIIDHGVINTEVLSNAYMRIIGNVLDRASNRRNVIIFLVIFAVISYMLVPLGFVKNEFFPKTDEDTIYISVELPPGTSLDKTSEEARALQKEVRTIPELNYSVVETGTSFSGRGDRSSNTNSFLITLDLKDKKERNRTSIEIAETLRNKYKNYAKGDLSVRELSGGPPAGADIQITLLGEDLNTLDKSANKIIAYLEKQPGVTDPEKSVKPGTSKITFIPDPAKLAAEGISRQDLSLWLRTYATGFTLDSIRLDEDTDIIMRLTDRDIQPEDLGSLYIQSPRGNIPLISLGELKLGNNPTLINHEDTTRSLTISAAVAKGFNTTEINRKLENYANTDLKLPEGYSWKTGGVNEENQKSVNSILQSMVLSFILILATMVIEFRSYRQAAIVMLSIPLAVSGVFYIFGLTGTPLSFPALIGVLALFGIVVTNAIVVVEKINDNRREGMALKHAIVDASGSRLEPVLLTSLATILGLLPITLSDPLWRGLGGAIIAGLFFSGMIKLFFVPVVYYMWFRSER